ncbi:MAG: YebC/PmpR family DNA-binding transcriptional regulator [Parcubacteria group bacterium]|nr:YebC/PmpR family DNA-binding transcriptional regulator [Parcubacteria group bacterium]
MSGHSKWNNIRVKKGAADAKRAQNFTKLARIITVAVKKGGPDPKFNFSLRLAVDRAKESNVPKDNIDRAIKKGTGELAGEEIFQNRYEGFGPGGAAVIVDTMTDNPNRTVAELKHAFSKAGGNLAGSVAWQFDPKGVIHVVGEAKRIQDEEWMLSAIEAGIDDAQADEDDLMILTPPQSLQEVKDWLEGSGITVESAQITLLPKERMAVADAETKDQLARLIESVEAMDDVEKVYHNADL